MRVEKYLFALMAGLVMLFSACQDDDSFTVSPQYTLSFSSDTIKLDTVFSRIPTATKTIWVYNRSGDGIRVRLLPN